MAKIGSEDTPIRHSKPSADDESYDIRIARDGTWYYCGSPIGRIGLVKLFASVLRRDDAGDYWLITPAERGRIQVDDAPFTAVEVFVEGAGRGQVLRFRCNLDQEVVAGPGNAILIRSRPGTDEPSPYIELGDGIEALIVRSVYYQLADLTVEEEGRLGVWSQGTFFAMDQDGGQVGNPAG